MLCSSFFISNAGCISRRTSEQAFAAARKLGYPCMVRPSYVLGGRAMEIVYSDAQLNTYLTETTIASDETPVLVDKFLAGAIELDVDALCDTTGHVTICGASCDCVLHTSLSAPQTIFNFVVHNDMTGCK